MGPQSNTTGVLLRRGTFKHGSAGTGEKDKLEMKGEAGVTYQQAKDCQACWQHQTPEKAIVDASLGPSEGGQPCPCLGFGLLVSRTLRE